MDLFGKSEEYHDFLIKNEEVRQGASLTWVNSPYSKMQIIVNCKTSYYTYLSIIVVRQNCHLPSHKFEPTWTTHFQRTQLHCLTWQLIWAGSEHRNVSAELIRGLFHKLFCALRRSFTSAKSFSKVGRRVCTVQRRVKFLS